jgi:hypothetical protein
MTLGSTNYEEFIDILLLSQEGSTSVSLFLEYRMQNLCAQLFIMIAHEESEMPTVSQPAHISH